MVHHELWRDARSFSPSVRRRGRCVSASRLDVASTSARPRVATTPLRLELLRTAETTTQA